MPVIFITGSRHKFEEIAAILPGLERLDIDLPEIQEIDARKVIAAKLHAARERVSGAIIVEDTSLHLEALGGLPGPLIKWFMKTIGNEGLLRLCQSLGNDRAIARTTIGLLAAGGEEFFFAGEITGRIVAPTAASDFGWDPLFLPDGSSRTFAELDLDAKNKISMRAAAARQLMDHLRNT